MPHDYDNKIQKIIGGKPSRENQVFGYPGDNVTLIKYPENFKFVTVRQLGEHRMMIRIDGKNLRVNQAHFGLKAYKNNIWNQLGWCEYVTQ